MLEIDVPFICSQPSIKIAETKSGIARLEKQSQGDSLPTFESIPSSSGCGNAYAHQFSTGEGMMPSGAVSPEASSAGGTPTEAMLSKTTRPDDEEWRVNSEGEGAHQCDVNRNERGCTVAHAPPPLPTRSPLGRLKSGLQSLDFRKLCKTLQGVTGTTSFGLVAYSKYNPAALTAGSSVQHCSELPLRTVQVANAVGFIGCSIALALADWSPRYGAIVVIFGIFSSLVAFGATMAMFYSC